MSTNVFAVVANVKEKWLDSVVFETISRFFRLRAGSPPSADEKFALEVLALYPSASEPIVASAMLAAIGYAGTPPQLRGRRLFKDGNRYHSDCHSVADRRRRLVARLERLAAL